MSVEERDHYTGHLTTGHDWNGIKELNTKVPRLLLICLALTFLFSLGYWYLLPAGPLGDSFTKGKLGLNQKDEIKEQLKIADIDKSLWSDPMLESSFDSIVANPELMKIVQESGPALFVDNCAMCHGQQAEGGLYFPRLTDSSWLWGGSPEQIQKTLTVGINAGEEGTRIAQMPAFGRTTALDTAAIQDVVTYVRSLSNKQVGDGSRATEALSVARGAPLYKTNCSACHGANGLGNIALGAPNLTDQFWLYGSDEKSITQTIVSGRAGIMPAWQGRLDEVEIKILSVYVAGIHSSRASAESENSNAENAN